MPPRTRRAPAPLPPAAALQLPPRPSSPARDGLITVAAAIALAGVASIQGVATGLVVGLLLGGVIGGTLVGIASARKAARADMRDRLVEALGPLLSAQRLDRRTVRLSKWGSGWPGSPAQVFIRYNPRAADSEPAWLSNVLEVVGRRLLQPYECAQHDQRRCRLELRPADLNAPKTAPIVIRAERAMSELIGSTAKLTATDVDEDGVLKSFEVAHENGARLAVSGYRDRVERVISTMNTGRWRAIWNLEKDTVRFEQRPTLPRSVWLPTETPDNVDDLLANYRSVKIPYAVDEDGNELYWQPGVTPQAMVVGGTGTGKTSTAHALLGKITQMGWPVWVSDAKRVEFLGFRDWPNVQIVAGSIPQQVALVHRTWLVMENRYRLIEEGKATVNDFEPLVVFLDEFAEFRSGLLEWYPTVKAKGDPSKPPTLAQVASLARKARTARIHLVLATQRPDAEFLGGEMRDNFGQRMSMGRLSPQGAMMMWENPTLGVALPRGVTGRAVAVNPQGVPVEAQAYRFPDPDSGDSEEQELLRKLRPKKSLHPRLVIVPPEGELDLDTGEPAELTFTDYANAEWDTAENRPDLDPLQQAAGDHDGRALSSTMASLGIGGMSRPSRQFVLPTSTSDPVPSDALELDGVVDDYEGYQQPEPLSPTTVSVGDLIEVDEGSGVWVVVDEAPEPDPADPGLVAISWRGDGDESGSMSIPDDDAIPVRRPEEYFNE